MPEDDNKIKLEEVDEHFCEGCQHQFKELSEKEKECSDCIFNTIASIS